MKLPLCVRINEADHLSRNALKADGWREIERLVIFELDYSFLEAPEINVTNTLPLAELVPKIQKIGCQSRHGRLFADPQVSEADAICYRKRMIERTFKSSRSERFLAFIDNDLAGFLIAHQEGDNMRIDFIAVDKKFRRKGVARAMISKLWWQRNMPIVAGTQSSNTASVAMYDRLGFHVEETMRTFHK